MPLVNVLPLLERLRMYHALGVVVVIARPKFRGLLVDLRCVNEVLGVACSGALL